MKKFVSKARQFVGRAVMALAIVLGIMFATDTASAQTDITGTISSLSTIWTAVAGLAITVVLFVLGRRMIRKL